jgi:hypothetical protein
MNLTAVLQLEIARPSAQMEQEQATLGKTSTWEESMKTCGTGAVLAAIRLAR